jgi:hypothetical protein
MSQTMKAGVLTKRFNQVRKMQAEQVKNRSVLRSLYEKEYLLREKISDLYVLIKAEGVDKSTSLTKLHVLHQKLNANKARIKNLEKRQKYVKHRIAQFFSKHEEEVQAHLQKRKTQEHLTKISTLAELQANRKSIQKLHVAIEVMELLKDDVRAKKHKEHISEEQIVVEIKDISKMKSQLREKLIVLEKQQNHLKKLRLRS